jgi:hypothetical protein
VHILLVELSKLVVSKSVECFECFECFVLEKPTPRPNKSNTSFKDGFHLVIPGIVTRPELQRALRDAVLPFVSEVFGDFFGSSSSRDAEDIYDESVIERNGWLLYGSKKQGEDHPWTLSRVFAFSLSFESLLPLPPKMEHTFNYLQIQLLIIYFLNLYALLPL